ncbi:MAG: hypothetical protein MI741_23305 [Rhodospirillales bacterium]|nr:hypothetical protein [Rhodospirillales bacterium]
MKRFSCLFVFLVSISGCVTYGNIVTVWEKEGVTPEQERLDLADCEFQAKAHTEEALYAKEHATERYRELRDMCLKAKGYRMISREFKKN